METEKLPSDSEIIVSLIEFKGRLILATTIRMYELEEDYSELPPKTVFKPIKFEYLREETESS